MPTPNGTQPVTPAVNLPVPVQITTLILNWLQNLVVFAVVPYLAYIGNANHDKVQKIEEGQVQTRATAADVQKKLDLQIATESAKSKEQAQATAVNLWSNWKYLDSFAQIPGAPQRDKDKAAEAKRVYDEFVKNNPKD